MSGIEPVVFRAVTQAGQKAFTAFGERRQRKTAIEEARAPTPARVAHDLWDELDEAQAHRLNGYLTSPEFEEVALQYLLGKLQSKKAQGELLTNIRHQIRHGISRLDLPAELRLSVTDVILDSVRIAAESSGPMLPRMPVGPVAHLVAAAAANTALLRDIGDLAAVNEFAVQLRAQVAALHATMRLPHLGVNRAVPYHQLYVEPQLRPLQPHLGEPGLDELAHPGRRSVILGDPGAGKSTLAAKRAHDVAANLVAGAEGRVPFPLVLRNFTTSFRTGGVVEAARRVNLGCSRSHACTVAIP